MRHSHLALGVLSLALPALAQGPVSPGLSSVDQVSKVFDINKAPFTGTSGTGGNAIMQISFEKIVGDSAGTWTVGLTVQALNTTYGGDSSSQCVLMGKFDQVKQVFTPSLDGKALSSTNHDFGLMFEPTLGRYCVFDRYDLSNNHLGVFFASRSNFTQPFGKPVQISGIQGSGVGDPSIGNVGGKLKLFYAGSNPTQGIWMADLDISNLSAPKAVGTPVLVSTGHTSGAIAHSPSPITGADGDVEGLFLASRVSSASDMYLADDLDPSTPIVLVNTDTYWQNNGGVAGGTFHWADASSTPTGYYVATAESQGAWLLGDIEALNGTMNITGAAHNPTSSPLIPSITVLFISGGFGSPIQLPGWNGSFGLDLRTYAPFGAMTHSDASEMASMSFPVPNLAQLKGITFIVQGLNVHPVKQLYTWTNTARLTITK